MKKAALTTVAGILATGFLATAAQAICPAPPVVNNNATVIQLNPNGDAMSTIGLVGNVDATEKGALVYDWANDTISICDGTNWKQVVASTGGAGAASDYTPPTGRAQYNLVFSQGYTSGPSMTNVSITYGGVDPTKHYFVEWDYNMGSCEYPNGNPGGSCNAAVELPTSTSSTYRCHGSIRTDTNPKEPEQWFYAKADGSGHYRPAKNANGYTEGTWSGTVRSTAGGRWDTLPPGCTAQGKDAHVTGHAFGHVRVYEVTFTP